MDLFRRCMSAIKKTFTKKSANSSVNNPVTTQNTSNVSSPHFVTHVHNYPPNYRCNEPLAPMPGCPTSSNHGASTSRAPSLTEEYQQRVPYCYAPPERSSPRTSQRLSSSPYDVPKPTEPQFEWVVKTIDTAEELSNVAVVGGYDWDGSPLWVIRTVYCSQLLPAKLNIKFKAAFVAWYQDERDITVFEVLCIFYGKAVWKEDSDGKVPINAIEGGKTTTGEKLYVGRTTHESSLIPGKIQPSHKCCYVTYGGKTHSYKSYEVLCITI